MSKNFNQNLKNSESSKSPDKSRREDSLMYNRVEADNYKLDSFSKDFNFSQSQINMDKDAQSSDLNNLDLSNNEKTLYKTKSKNLNNSKSNAKLINKSTENNTINTVDDPLIFIREIEESEKACIDDYLHDSYFIKVKNAEFSTCVFTVTGILSALFAFDLKNYGSGYSSYTNNPILYKLGIQAALISVTISVICFSKLSI